MCRLMVWSTDLETPLLSSLGSICAILSVCGNFRRPHICPEIVSLSRFPEVIQSKCVPNDCQTNKGMSLKLKVKCKMYVTIADGIETNTRIWKPAQAMHYFYVPFYKELFFFSFFFFFFTMPSIVSVMKYSGTSCEILPWTLKDILSFRKCILDLRLHSHYTLHVLGLRTKLHKKASEHIHGKIRC